MINWKKEGIANSVTGWLFLGPVIFLVILTSMADIIVKSPTMAFMPAVLLRDNVPAVTVVNPE